MLPSNTEIAGLIASRHTMESLIRISAFFDRAGTLDLHPKDNGLYPAGGWQRPDRFSGYQNAWLRDTVMVSNYQREMGNANLLGKTIRTLTNYFQLHRRRFTEIIAEPELRHDPSRRPHVRFDPDTLGEISQKWAHAQNDALGYALWLAFRTANEGLYRLDPRDHGIYALFPGYFAAIRYWEDPDSGHWEEDRRVNNSSIGVVVAALEEMKRSAGEDPQAWGRTELLEELIAHGRRALATLPAETPGEREADAALLFLAYPLEAVDDRTAMTIVQRVAGSLEAAHGIKRYLGDSYWCQEYDRLLGPGERTADFSDRIAERNRLLAPGCEAQWCIFDPIVSVIWGRRYLETGDPGDLERQTRYFNRALRQITPDGLCPELYYMRDASTRAYTPNDHVPLAWTQANLGCALLYMRRSIQRAAALS